MGERRVKGVVGKCLGILVGLMLCTQVHGFAAMGRSVEAADDRAEAADRTSGALPIQSLSNRAAQQSSAPQAAGGNRAGEVTNAIPDEVVERPGTVSALPLKLNDSVYWQDVVRTLDDGRVRIQLLDSSVLNIGVRSVMKIIQHDPQSQQTQLELTLGSVRGEVKKLTSKGGKFEIQTPTAVIGVVGTVFDVEASETTTHVHVLEGKVRVRHRNPKLKGVIVREGQETHVAHNVPPAKPTHAPNYKQEGREAKQHRQAQQSQEKQQKQQQKQQQRQLKQEEKQSKAGERKPKDTRHKGSHWQALASTIGRWLV